MVPVTLMVLALAAAMHCDVTGREKIMTLSCSTDERMATTGNAVQNDIKYEKMHVMDREQPFDNEKVPQKTIQDLNFYTTFKNKIIMDFPSEDPKQFRPDLPNYYRVASKRGVVFTAIAVFLLVTLFAVFYLRVFSGECGGYKTIIRKPTKAQRYSIFTRLTAGLLLFTAGLGATGYLFQHDRNLSIQAGDDLVAANDRQVNLITQITKNVRAINKKKFNIIYSVLSYEHFQIGWFMDNLLESYKASTKHALDIRDVLFLGTKNNFFIKIMFIILAVVSLLVTWFFVYKNRSLTHGLTLAFLMGLVAIYMMHVFGSSFGHFSIFTELCVESVDTFNADKPAMRVRFDNSFQSFLTCLPQKETEAMVAQMNSLLIAENTLLTILRNFFKTVDLKALSEHGNFEEAASVAFGFSKIREAIVQYTQKDDKVDQVLRTNMLKVLETARDLPIIYKDASELHNCLETKRWNHHLNNSLCTDGLWYQYFSLITFLVAFLGVLVMGAGFFSSENIIRGLYNEEIQYVKTNKLRYDWN